MIIDGFIPVMKTLKDQVGFTCAGVYGVVYLFEHGRDKSCYASLKTIGEEVGLKEEATRLHLNKLVELGYLAKESRLGYTSVYKTTGMLEMIMAVENTNTGMENGGGYMENGRGVPKNHVLIDELIDELKDSQSSKKSEPTYAACNEDGEELNAFSDYSRKKKRERKDANRAAKLKGGILPQYKHFLDWFLPFSETGEPPYIGKNWNEGFAMWSDLEATKGIVITQEIVSEACEYVIAWYRGEMKIQTPNNRFLVGKIDEIAAKKKRDGHSASGKYAVKKIGENTYTRPIWKSAKDEALALEFADERTTHIVLMDEEGLKIYGHTKDEQEKWFKETFEVEQ